MSERGKEQQKSHWNTCRASLVIKWHTHKRYHYQNAGLMWLDGIAEVRCFTVVGTVFGYWKILYTIVWFCLEANFQEYILPLLVALLDVNSERFYYWK